MTKLKDKTIAEVTTKNLRIVQAHARIDCKDLEVFCKPCGNYLMTSVNMRAWPNVMLPPEDFRMIQLHKCRINVKH